MGSPLLKKPNTFFFTEADMERFSVKINVPKTKILSKIIEIHIFGFRDFKIFVLLFFSKYSTKTLLNILPQQNFKHLYFNHNNTKNVKTFYVTIWIWMFMNMSVGFIKPAVDYTKSLFRKGFQNYVKLILMVEDKIW